MFEFGKKSLLTASATALAIASLTINPEVAKAVEGFARHEHPFQSIGAGKDQQEGNTTCWQLFSDLGKRATSEYQIGSSDSYLRGTIPVDKYAWDGTWINYANHVWYHQQRGICVANTNW